ncbi:unnamed protein product, partial [Heterobilharzia americana]
MVSSKLGYPLALVSGFFAACTGLYSKLLSEDYIFVALVFWFPNVNKNVLFIATYGGAIIMNAIMWLAFVTALSMGRNSVVVMATNTLSNFAFSAVFGRWIFQEELNTKWLAVTYFFLLFGPPQMFLESRAVRVSLVKALYITYNSASVSGSIVLEYNRRRA